MATMTQAGLGEGTGFAVQHQRIEVPTTRPLEFVDFTRSVSEFLERSGVRNGLINIQSLHTTAAILVGENEPLLLEDMRRVLERLASCQEDYRHDDFSVRTVNLCPDETKNGHSHCKAMFLRTAETLNVVEGALELGRWQRIFLVELDGPRTRNVSLTIMGER